MKTIDLSNKTIAISRVDSIGDVILTLPTCAWIKRHFPSAKLLFFGKRYTMDILRCYPHIDEIVNVNEWEGLSEENVIAKLKALHIDVFVHVFPKKELATLVKKAKIPFRIGTSHRLFHWTTCNVKLNFTRKNSNFHEAQLNFELLKPFGVNKLPTREELVEWMADFKAVAPLPEHLSQYLESSKRKIVLHPKSQGSSVEWPIEKYVELAISLANDGQLVFFSGTEEEGLLFRKYLPKHENIKDLSGKCSLGELIGFIEKCDALVACSTGPLHIAAALGIRAVGLYTDLRPMHPGRWAPIGKNSVAYTIGNQKNPSLNDINKIQVADVIELLK